MDSVRFKEIIGAFLDSTDQFDTDKGQFVIQLGQEVISFTLTNVAGTLWVTEGIHKHTAEEWIITGNFHFAFPAATVYRQLPLLRSFSAFVPEPKNRTRLAEPLPEPKGHDLPHFEAIFLTPLRQLPSFVQIGFALPPQLLSAWHRQSLDAPQHASEQAPCQMALCQQ